MASDARYRWAGLLGALTLTVGAIFYPLDDNSLRVVPAAASSRTPVKTVMDAFGAAPVATDPAGVGGDPFAPRGWTASPPLPSPAPLVATTPVAAVDLTPAGPPDLPFRYVGSLVDGAEQTVYLARGDQAYVVKAGDVIDTNYKVLNIAATQIQFEHIPTGAKQALVFPARDN